LLSLQVSPVLSLPLLAPLGHDHVALDYPVYVRVEMREILDQRAEVREELLVLFGPPRDPPVREIHLRVLRDKMIKIPPVVEALKVFRRYRLSFLVRHFAPPYAFDAVPSILLDV